MAACYVMWSVWSVQRAAITKAGGLQRTVAHQVPLAQSDASASQSDASPNPYTRVQGNLVVLASARRCDPGFGQAPAIDGRARPTLKSAIRR